MPLVLNGATSGSTTVQATDAVTATLTLPSNTGTLVGTGNTGQITQAMLASGVSGNGPAFSAKADSNQSITTSTWTKVTLNSEDFDTNNNFASSRFTPTVAGYYQINGEIRSNGTNITIVGSAIYKNGSLASQFTFPIPTATNQYNYQVSKLIYMNGSTDYVELYGIVVGTSPSFDNGGGFATSQFNGALVRSA